MPGHAAFWDGMGKKFGTSQQIWGKSDGGWGHVTTQDAEQFNVIHMDPMSDDAVSNQLLSLNLCLAMPVFGLGWAKHLELVANFGQN